MQLWTIQLAQWRRLPKDRIVLLDTTVRTGDPVFAPSWEIVMDVKAGKISEQEYTDRYKEMMRASWKANRTRWVEVCGLGEVAIACYCGAGKFCHRHLLKSYLESSCKSLGIPFSYMGEF